MYDQESYSSASDREDDFEVADDKDVVHFNKDGLLQMLTEIKTDFDWLQQLNVTSDVVNQELPVSEEDHKEKSGSVHNDFQREMTFYCQAQAAAKEALSKLRELGIPTQRPGDYFAEMVKTDTHMQKVRARLQSIKLMKETAEKNRKMRQMKKFGKKIQQDVLEKRRKEKKRILNEVGRMRKGKRNLPHAAGEDKFEINTESFSKEDRSGLNKKRARKDDRYGYGGKKKKFKKNSAESSGDMASFKPHIHGKKPKQPKQGKKFKTKRLGKSRRAKQKGKKK